VAIYKNDLSASGTAGSDQNKHPDLAIRQFFATGTAADAVAANNAIRNDFDAETNNILSEGPNGTQQPDTKNRDGLETGNRRPQGRHAKIEKEERMSKVIGTISSEGFNCVITEDADGRVHFRADADIDADGANGQGGGPPAYKNDDSGTELLANGGMKIVNGKVICAHSWARDIVILDDDNQPKVFPGGVIASNTWYRHPGMPADAPGAYVDAETVPYIVVPPIIIQRTAGIVRGCKARVTYKDKVVDCVVADRGPANRIGELSIAAAKLLGLPFSPRHGGTELPEVLYELWPGVPAEGYVLQAA
jgi:hypothetical protein